MTGVEGVNPDRIRILKYSYDFAEYANPQPNVVDAIGVSIKFLGCSHFPDGA